jgi:hypothetical protein
MKHDESDDRDDGDDERMQVQGFVEVSLKERDAGSGEAASGAWMSSDDGERAEGDAEDES